MVFSPYLFAQLSSRSTSFSENFLPYFRRMPNNSPGLSSTAHSNRKHFFLLIVSGKVLTLILRDLDWIMSTPEQITVARNARLLPEPKDAIRLTPTL